MSKRVFAVCALFAVLLAVAPMALVGCPAPTSNDSQHGAMLGAGSAGAWSYVTGTTATVTVAAGYTVNYLYVHSTAGGSFTITPGNAGIDAAVSGSSIVLPANTGLSFT